MNSLLASPLGAGALLGIAGTALLLTWKAGASRWSTWFPLMRRAAEWTLIGAAVAWALTLLLQLSAHVEALREFGFALVAGLVAAPFVKIVARRRPAEKTERGAALATSQEVTRLTKKAKGGSDLVLGGVPLLKDNEPYHFLIAGSTGSGKSVAIRTVADELRRRGDTVIMVDSGGEFVNRYFKPDSDHIINPFDSRCVAWSPLAEMDGPWDAQGLARSIVPDGHGESKEWNGYAQTLVTSVLQKMAEEGDRRLGRFLYLVQQAPVQELQTVLQGTPALAQLSSEKTFGSIRTIASNYLLPYGYLGDSETPFSVSRFVREHKPGFLFLSYRDDQLDSLRNLISAVLDVAARTLLALQPDSRRRVWLIIDEFASIGKVQSIEAVATKARKNGGCLLIGLQSVSQIRDRYGEHAAQSILSCLSTWLVLRCTDAETADYMSKYIGEAQVVRVNKSESKNVSGDSDSSSEQRTTERVVLASEVQALPNLEGFLKTPGGLPVCKVKLGFPPNVSSKQENFAARDFKENPLLDVGKYRPAAVSAAKTGVAATSGTAVKQVAPNAQPALPKQPSTPAAPPSQFAREVGEFKPRAAAPAPKVARREEPAPKSAGFSPRVQPPQAAPTERSLAHPSKPSAPVFKSPRLNELLARHQAIQAGKPVSVSPAVMDAATRVALALAERMHAAAALAEKAAATKPQRAVPVKPASQESEGSIGRGSAAAAPVVQPSVSVPPSESDERQLAPKTATAPRKPPVATKPERESPKVGDRRGAQGRRRRGPGVRSTEPSHER